MNEQEWVDWYAQCLEDLNKTIADQNSDEYLKWLSHINKIMDYHIQMENEKHERTKQSPPNAH